MTNTETARTSLVLIGLPGAGLDPVAQVLRSKGVDVATTSLDQISDPYFRRSLSSPGTTTAVVWVDGPDSELATRCQSHTASELRELRSQHLGHLTVAADVVVQVDLGVDLDESVVASRIDAALAEFASRPGKRTENVTLSGGRGYPIVVGRGVRSTLGEYLPAKAKRVAIVTQPGIGIEIETGREQRVFHVEDGEEAKRLEVLGQLASELAQWGMTRADCIVAVGGGVVTDLGGFLAASYHRGISVVHVPTTLLGQIDAAIGGKCGVNLAEGKNLVGAFWQPEAVICDVDTLATLPSRQFRAGMGELAKYHFLGGGRLDQVDLVERVARSAAIKADVVSGDEREGGRRAILNYGHTLAHALETLSGYGTILHGEAVAIGLIYAAELALRLGRIGPDRVLEHRRVVETYGLDAEFDPALDPNAIVDLFSRDKKAIDGITFVLDGPNGVEPVRVDDRELLLDALSVMAATGSKGVAGS